METYIEFKNNNFNITLSGHEWLSYNVRNREKYANGGCGGTESTLVLDLLLMKHPEIEKYIGKYESISIATLNDTNAKLDWPPCIDSGWFTGGTWKRELRAYHPDGTEFDKCKIHSANGDVSSYNDSCKTIREQIQSFPVTVIEGSRVYFLVGGAQ